MNEIIIKFRFYIMWTYIVALFVLLTTPLPLQEGYQTATYATYAHFLMFFILVVIVWFAYLFSIDMIMLIKLLAFAIIMEIIQLPLPYRVFDIMDMTMNVIGVLTAYLLLKILKNMFLNTS